jgi:hypothetical protein
MQFMLCEGKETMNTYEYEYTDTFAGEANYCWVKRGKVAMPELPNYGYDGANGYTRANKIEKRELMKKVKRELGLTGVRGITYNHGDMVEFRPYRSNTVLFVTYCED